MRNSPHRGLNILTCVAVLAMFFTIAADLFLIVDKLGPGPQFFLTVLLLVPAYLAGRSMRVVPWTPERRVRWQVGLCLIAVIIAIVIFIYVPSPNWGPQAYGAIVPLALSVWTILCLLVLLSFSDKAILSGIEYHGL